MYSNMHYTFTVQYNKTKTIIILDWYCERGGYYPLCHPQTAYEIDLIVLEQSHNTGEPGICPVHYFYVKST